MKHKLFDLTNPQKAIWLTEQFYKGQNINNICGTLRIFKKLDFKILERAINLFVENYDANRIRLELQPDGSISQYFEDYSYFNIDTVLVKDEKSLKELEKHIVSKPFELLNNSLVLFTMFKFPNGTGGFIVNYHHIIADSWSCGITSDQILYYYSQLLNENEVSFNNSFSYKDYIFKEKEYLNSSKFLKDKAYWEEIYSTVPEIAAIPSSLSNNSTLLSANRVLYSINKELLLKINKYCKTHEISPYNFYMSVFGLYIGKVTNLDDFVIGTPILNRTNAIEKNTAGMFINTAPLRMNINYELSFADFVSQIAIKAMGILRHQRYSYQYIIEDLRKKNPALPKLYNIIFSYQITKMNENSEFPHSNSWEFNHNIYDDIDIHMMEYDDHTNSNINIAYDYKISKYTEQDMKNIHNRIIHMINQILENETISLKDIEIVTPEEKNKILYEFNDTKRNYPKEKTLSMLFEEQVEKTPDNVAVVFENQKLTYKELNEKANSLANYLRDNGVRNGDTIGVLLNRSFDLIITIFALIKLGAIYILIDPLLPEKRVDYIIENSKSKYCITNRKINIYNYININNINLNNYSNKNIINENYSNNLCIIYTSGSTGNPKGTLLHNKGFINLIYAFDIEMNISKYKNILGISTVSFDMFAVELLSPIAFGNTLILANEEEQKNPIAMSELIIKHKIDFFVTTPSRVELLMLPECKNSLQNVKAFLLGGEKLTSNLYLRLKEVTSAKIYNGYGPTEITACCTSKLVTSTDITIGKALSNTNVYICDQYLNLLPPNVSGEICVTGVGVANGYIYNKISTEKSFIRNPYGEGFLYKTGDIGKYRNNGEIEYIGRSDFQVKIRGQRIELGEIENCILQYPNITKVAVIKKTIHNSDVLCSYFLSGNPINITELRKYVSSILPKYMVPTYFTQLEDFPYTVSGKIDTKNLPEPQTKMKLDHTIPPRNNIDVKLINLIKDLLDVNYVGINDSFYELGGDSLFAINLCIKIQKEFNAEILIKDIMENPIIKDLSDIIANKLNTYNIRNISVLPESNSYPISFAQKRIYFACQVAGSDSILYNTPGGIIFDGNVDIQKLEDCLISLIRRHESLRTYFELENENIVQKVANNVHLKLDIIKGADFRYLNNIFKNFIKPFDLSKPPLFRTKYVSFVDGKSILLLDMHHIIFDGFSAHILTNELCDLYNDKTLPKLSITYKDYAYFEKEELEQGKLKEAEEYWLNQFNDEIPVLNMPTTYTRPVVQTFDGKKFYSSINTNKTQEINKLSKKLGVTPYMILISAYYILLSKYTSQDDIVIGSPIAARDKIETKNIIGMFVNTLALRNKIDSKLTLKEFILSIKENLLNSYKYQLYPFDELVDKLEIKRDTSRNPLFDTMFMYQAQIYADINFDGIKAEYYIPDTNISKFDLSLEVVPTNSMLKLSFEYATKLFDEEFIKNLSNHYLNIVDYILENIDIKISDICMLSEEEKNKILYEFNDTKRNYPKEKTLSMLFEEQVEKTPDNVAVVFENQKLTYRELNEKANSLANYLRDNGIKRNDLVGIMVNRSLEMIISILAVLKSGGAYIPIDPSFPEDRINYMLNMSNAKILLTQKKLENKLDFNNKIFVDLTNNNIYSLPNNNLTHINLSEDLAYVIFTSGSTGKPKGVMLKHKAISNLVNYCNNYIVYLKYPKNDTIISITTISFDIFIYETLISLQKGLKVIIANENEKVSPQLLNNLIEENNATIIQSTPSIMQIFVNNIENIPSLKKLKYVILAGEQLPQKLLSTLYSYGITIYNGYGPSETTIFSTLTQMNDGFITIGKPLDNTQIYILDKNLNPQPVGISGEIYISGDGVGMGYLNNEILTQKSFIKNPFNVGTVMYKSGDIGKYNKDGTITCLGRSDNQVKIRGQRIELEEIETALQKYPHIQNAVAVKQIINNREFISAYYISDKRIIISELRKYLSYLLPRYMIPSYYVALDKLPYTPNGKINKKTLPIPKEILSTDIKKYKPPVTRLQKQLVSIWEKILNTSSVGINDNFFELGGDSILAMSLNIELLSITDKITYSDIFRFPTIVELEERINSNVLDQQFKKIENLSNNHISVLEHTIKKEKIKHCKYKNILLTGGTGFLGVHILDQFIKYEKCNIYCIVREEPGFTVNSKLRQKLNYYFGNKYDELIGQRIFAVSGNISSPFFGLNQENLLELANSVDLVVNCAARVTHFGNYEDFYNSNVNSVKYMIEFCNKFNKKLYHISTLSIADTKLDSSYLSINKRRKKVIFDESKLYSGQIIENVYIRSKFEAESYILDSISKGLDGYILRMGNLMPRYHDGMFQENVLDNAFINKFITFIKIGFIPDYLQNQLIDLTPIDYAAKAVYKLITHPNNINRIFHIYNHKHTSVKKFLKILKKYNYTVDIVSDDAFKEKIKSILYDESSKKILNNLINDFDNNLHLIYKTDIIVKSKFTIRYLRHLGFHWPILTNQYLKKFIELLRKVI